MQNGDRILVIKPSSFGDIIHTLPAVAALARAYPASAIDWVINPEWAPLIESVPNLDRNILFPRRDFRGLPGIARGYAWAKRELKREAYGLVIDFQGLLRSGMMALATGCPTRIGFSKAREGARLFYSDCYDIDNFDQLHAIDRNFRLAAAVTELAPNEGNCPLPEGKSIEGVPKHPFLLLHPFSRGRGKSLSVREVYRLAESLSEFPIVLVGSQPEGSEKPESWPPNLVDFLGKTDLHQLITLMRAAHFTVSVDSGPLHLAAGITQRVLGVFTWSDPWLVGPYRRDSYVFREGALIASQDLTPGCFSNERHLRDIWAAKPDILSEEERKQLVAFLSDRMREPIS